MALDQRIAPTFQLGPPPIAADPAAGAAPAAEAQASSTPGRMAPMQPMERAWLLTWAGRLEPRLHGAIAADRFVTDIVRRQPDPAIAGATRPARGSRWLGGVPAAGSAPAPRSMGVVPQLAYGLSRRTAELLAVLSACLDPAERRAGGHALRVAYLASRIAAELEMGDDARADLLYAGLLRDAGSIGPDVDGETGATADRGAPGGRRRAAGTRKAAVEVAAPHLSKPDRAAAMVRVLGLPQGVLEAVASADERWDGRGPRRERRTAVPTGARVLSLAAQAATAVVGVPEPAALPGVVERALRRERGRILEPELVDRVIPLGRSGLWADAMGGNLLERMLELEPLHRVRHTDDRGLDAVAGAFADLIDSRTPAFGRHGRRVADVAARTSVALGLEPRVAADVRRAGLLHDLGRLLVPIAVLEKPDALTGRERQVMDDHARAGAAVLERSHVLGGLAPLIAGHHEKLDGTGRFPAMVDDDRELGARIIALADRFEAMTADRPWRPAIPAGHAWRELRGITSEPLAGVVLRIMERTIGDA